MTASASHRTGGVLVAILLVLAGVVTYLACVTHHEPTATGASSLVAAPMADAPAGTTSTVFSTEPTTDPSGLLPLAGCLCLVLLIATAVAARPLPRSSTVEPPVHRHRPATVSAGVHHPTLSLEALAIARV